MNIPSMWFAFVLACLLAVRQILRVVRSGVKAVVPRQHLRFDDTPATFDPAQQAPLFRLGSLSLSDSCADSDRVRR